MIKSMTGYGRGVFSDQDTKILVEIKSLNHRYCDMSIRPPRKLRFLESSIKKMLQKDVARGKIDISISYDDLTNKDTIIKYSNSLASKYLDELNKMAKDLNLNMDVGVKDLSQYPEILTLEDDGIDENVLWDKLKIALTEAKDSFISSRVAEGSNLKNDIIEKINKMNCLVLKIEKCSPEIIIAYRNKLKAKIEELLVGRKFDDSLIITEVALFADKVCTDEEIVRLKSHISNMIQTLNEANNIGRKLDFISQEMQREANTILSKANDITVSNMAIDLKTIIEQIREQVQNIE